MKRIVAVFKKIEYELPVFLILAVKLPVEQFKPYGFVYLALCALSALFLGRFMRCAGCEKKSILLFIALLLAGDLIKILFLPSFSDPVDIVRKAISLLCFILTPAALRGSDSGFRKPVFAWGAPALCSAGTLAWPSFLFFYLPAVLIMSAHGHRPGKKNRLDFAYHATWFLPVLLACAYAVFGIFTGKKLLGFIPFPYGFKILPLRDISLALAAMLPLIVLFIFIWFLALRAAADRKTKRLLAVCLAEPAAVMLLSLFAYYAVSDGWKYCIAAVVFTWFCLLFYFLNAREKTVADAFEKTAGYLMKNPFILLALLIYLVKSAQIFYPV